MRKIARIAFVLVLLIVGAISALLMFQVRSTSQLDPPAMQAGKLPACGTRPNCVSSQSVPGSIHYIEPISTTTPAAASITQSIEDIGGVIHSSSENAVVATFTSNLMGYVDDLMVLVDPDGETLHIRSSSRMGYSDMGANRGRVEALRARCCN